MKKHIIKTLLLALVITALFFHIQNWQDTGRYVLMDAYLGTGKAALTVSYDIGITLIFAGVLGMFFSQIIDIFLKVSGGKKK